MKKAILILFFLSLTACGIFQKRQDLPIIITEEHTEYVVPEVNIDSYLLDACKDLGTLESTESFNDVLIITKENTIKFAECRDKHKALVEILRKSLNLKVPSND